MLRRFLISKPKTRKKREGLRPGFDHRRKRIFTTLAVFTALTYVANAIIIIARTRANRQKGWECEKDYVVSSHGAMLPSAANTVGGIQVYIVGNVSISAVLILSIVDYKPAPTYAHLATWIAAIIMETTTTAVSVSAHSRAHREHWLPHARKEMFIDIVRVICFAALATFFIAFDVSVKSPKRKARTSQRHRDLEESAPLLGSDGQLGGDSNAGPDDDSNGTVSSKRFDRPRHPRRQNWWDFESYRFFLPYLWPYESRKLQCHALICIAIIIVQRIVNVLVPIQLNNILTPTKGRSFGHLSGLIVLFLSSSFFQGSGLKTIRAFVWLPVRQHITRKLSVDGFKHIHRLGLDFHLNKRSGELMTAHDKVSSVNSFLNLLAFDLGPTIFDLFLAVGYFLVKFDVIYAEIVINTAFWYVYTTIRMTVTIQIVRREADNAAREAGALKYDSVAAYDTVKYFNAESREVQRYGDAVERQHTVETKAFRLQVIVSSTQSAIFWASRIILCCTAGFQVWHGQRRLGDLAALIFYTTQLQQSLNALSSSSSIIQQSMIDAEHMLKVFKAKPSVADKPDAQQLPTCEGDIRFENVDFGYDKRTSAARGLTFNCRPGTTTALVGESGGGKSTIISLLCRFYNPRTGSIKVDGHNVQDIRIDSLREHIGVVPQEPVLFNERLMYNLKYASQNATDEDVYQACRKASIHDAICSFPDGYDSKLGERGLRLSGGEKQRVAIARAMIKNPRIILLDEATAALDTDTERKIHEKAFGTFTRGHTVLIIAHRLSTITNADQILVISGGQVIEAGTHNDLLTRKGRYADMWEKQASVQRAKP